MPSMGMACPAPQEYTKMPRRIKAIALLPILSAMLLTPAAAWSEEGENRADDIEVTVRKLGATVVVDVGMPVKASLRSAWEVLTDYNHMADFFPNLDSSKIVEQQGNRLRIEQTGKVAYGPLSFPFESVRAIVLTPYSKVISRAVGGTIKQGEAITQLVSEGNTTRILYHSESVPNTWVPPGLGPNIIAGRTREQFASLREEILRRAGRERAATADTLPARPRGHAGAASGQSAGGSAAAGQGQEPAETNSQEK